MKKTRLLLLIGIMAIAVASCSSVRRRGPSERHVKRMVNYASRKLDLEKAQKDALDGLVRETVATMKENRQDHSRSMDSARQLFLQDSLTRDEILAEMDTWEEEREDMAEYMAGQVVKLHRILTPEQRLKLMEETERFREKRFR